jgi:hypothetical protein
MIHKITIHEHAGENENGYINWKEVYEQTTEDINLQAIVAIVNHINVVTEKA